MYLPVRLRHVCYMSWCDSELGNAFLHYLRAPCSVWNLTYLGEDSYHKSSPSGLNKLYGAV